MNTTTNTNVYPSGTHVTVGTKTVHLYAGTHHPYQDTPAYGYLNCATTLGGKTVVATESAVTCKTCAKHVG